ncbi:MAG TPA: hypothetical protein VNW52_10055 [Burkholderiaceae bacterium]|jgi:hypothetical protein|nr:hypothetical protein [Burkholderiaceae bacterium]
MKKSDAKKRSNNRNVTPPKIDLGPQNPEPDEWTVVHYTIEVLNDIRERLRAAIARGSSVTLDPDECVKVLACLRDPPNPRHAPKRNAVAIRQIQIGLYCIDLEHAGVPLKTAVEKTMQHFGVSPAFVYKARKFA